MAAILIFVGALCAFSVVLYIGRMLAISLDGVRMPAPRSQALGPVPTVQAKATADAQAAARRNFAPSIISAA